MSVGLETIEANKMRGIYAIGMAIYEVALEVMDLHYNGNYNRAADGSNRRYDICVKLPYANVL